MPRNFRKRNHSSDSEDDNAETKYEHRAGIVDLF